MKRVLPSLAISGCCSLAVLPSAHADTTDSSVTVFDKVVVSASRIEQTAQKETRSIDSVVRTQLDQAQPTSVAEALKFEPNVSVSGGPVPGNQSVNIRGLEGNKILQVIDGTRVNTNFNHRPSYFLDPSLVSQIDVVKGPVSSLWGSGAVGGVVSQKTISASDLVDEEETFGGFVKTSYNDNGNQWTGTSAIAGDHDAFNWLLGASYLDSNKMEQGNGDTLYGSETKNATGIAKVGWKITDSNTIGLNYRNANNDGHPPAVGSSDQQLNDPDKLIDRETTDENITLSYQFNPESEAINVDTKLYQNNTRIEEDNLFGSTDISEIETNGFSVTNQSKFGGFNLLGGIDGYEDNLDTARPASGNGRPNPPANASTTTMGAFLYGDYPILETVTVEAGVRYDSFDSKAEGFESSDESAVSPAAAIRWQAVDWAALSVRYDEAFRAPDVYELYMDGTHFAFYPGGPTNVFVANPDLNPETSKNVEVKGEFNFHNVIGKDKLNLVASVFENKVKDFIELSVHVPSNMPGYCFAPGMGAGCAGTSTSENVANARLKGFEFGASYQIDALTASLTYGQTRGKDEDTNEYLSGIPADKWVAALDYGVWSIDTNVGVKVLKASDQKRTPSDDSQGPYNGYTTTDFYASWEPSSQALEGVKVDFIVANAFDQNYRNAWTSVYEAGRSVRVAAQYNF